MFYLLVPSEIPINSRIKIKFRIFTTTVINSSSTSEETTEIKSVEILG